MTTGLTPVLAERFAALTLGHLERPWPFKLDHVMDGPDDARTPAELHPIFHGSFDWHGCVHGWWQVMELLPLFPDLPRAAEIATRADRMLVPDTVTGELATLERPSAAGFERPTAGRGCWRCTARVSATTGPGRRRWSRWRAPSPGASGAICRRSPIPCARARTPTPPSRC